MGVCVRVHASSCVCAHEFEWICANVCWRAHIRQDRWGWQMWVYSCMGVHGRRRKRGRGGEEEWGGSRVCMMEKRRIDMGAQWLLFEFHPSPHHCLHPSPPFLPTFLKAQTLPVVTLEYCRPGWSTPLLGRRMSAQARGSFDKQSIYWYMIKYARNHPTAEGYYSFNIIIWINKHSVEK